MLSAFFATLEACCNFFIMLEGKEWGNLSWACIERFTDYCCGSMYDTWSFSLQMKVAGNTRGWSYCVGGFRSGTFLVLVCKDTFCIGFLLLWDGWKLILMGSAVGTSGTIACAGVFRTSRGSISMCFHSKAGIEFRNEEEICAVCVGVGKWERLDFIWLEADSSYVVSLLRTQWFGTVEV